MGIETALLAVSAGLAAAQGISSYQSAKETAKTQQRVATETATAQQQAAKEEAAKEILASRSAAETQKLAYLKSGVALTGSPLLLLSETYQTGEYNADQIVEAGDQTAAQTMYAGSSSAAQTMASGRSSLLSGIGTAVSKGTSAYGSYQASTPKTMSSAGFSGYDPNVKASSIKWNT